MTHTPVRDRFAGKVAIVTGGAQGIGRAVAEELVKEGAKVVFTGLSAAGGRTEGELRALGGEATFLQGDHATEAFARETVDTALETYGSVDLLVNNAFSFTAKGMAASEADWMRSFTAGPLNYARMVQFAAPAMEARGGGAIVNVSSISAWIAQPDRWTYNAAKGAVAQLTKCQALDLAPLGIRVNSVDPAWIWTNETDKAANLDGGGRMRWDPIWGRFHMLRRMGLPIEVARPVLFLLSDDASFITGTSLMVDGGYLAMGPEGLGDQSSFAGTD
jgi:NAD(P)-dependent dehydrogenase (short-subunit alcohol dehydrogenase family)